MANRIISGPPKQKGFIDRDWDQAKTPPETRWTIPKPPDPKLAGRIPAAVERTATAMAPKAISNLIGIEIDISASWALLVPWWLSFIQADKCVPAECQLALLKLSPPVGKTPTLWSPQRDDRARSSRGHAGQPGRPCGAVHRWHQRTANDSPAPFFFKALLSPRSPC